MKILMLMQFPLYGSGSGNYTRKLAEKLAMLPNIEVAIAAPDTREIKNVKLYTLKPKRKVVFVSHPEYKRSKKYQDLSPKEFLKLYNSFAEQIVDVVEDFKPNVIHVNHCFFLTWIANYIKSFYGISYVIAAHGTGIYQTTIDKRYHQLTKNGIENSDFVLSNSNWTSKWLLRVFGSKIKNKSRILPCGIDYQVWNREEKIKIINDKYNLNGKKVVIFVGRLTWEKGVIYLLKAAKDIDAEIFIIGGGVLKNDLINYSKRKKLKNVHFLGYFGKEYIEELREFYKRADCVVLPSICDEGLGIVILEAMASKTPVVATNKGGIPLVVKDGKTGFLVRSKSSKLLSDAINKLLKDEKLAKTMAENASDIVKEKFDWIIIRDQAMKYYEITKLNTEKAQLKLHDSVFSKDKVEKEKAELKKKIGYAE